MRKAGVNFIPAFLICVCTNAVGQVYFDGLYGGSESGNGIASGGTLRTGNGFMTLSYKLHNGVSKPFLFFVDNSGVQTDSMSFAQPDTVYRMSFNVVDLENGSYIGLSSRNILSEPSETIGDICLIRFTETGLVLSEQYYGQANRREIPQRVIKTLDSGFAIAGQLILGTGDSAQGDSYLIKINNQGIQQWEQNYGGGEYDGSVTLLQTPESGYLLLGWTRSYGAGQRDFYLVKTDSLGNEEWHRTFGGSGNDVGSNIIRLMDGNYLLTGGSSPDGVNSHGRIYKVDTAGTVIWTKNYAMQSGNYLYRSIELEDGSLISCGLTNSTANGDDGWLIKTNSSGTLLWQKKYKRSNSTDLFYSILHTEDNGFLLSGQAINAQTGSQDAWLLKVDSIGCPYPNCLVGIEENEEKTVLVNVWPNPTAAFLNIEWQRAERAKISLFDLSGREVISLNGGLETIEQIDVSHLPNGLYVLHLLQGSSVVSMKIVVE